MTIWTPPTLVDALLAELPAPERVRPFSFYHPALRSMYKNYMSNESEWTRIGIIGDLPKPDGRSIPARVFDAHAAVDPSDVRLIHEIQPVNLETIRVRCGGCGRWRPPFTMINVMAYPETFEKPILKKEVPPGSGIMRPSHNPKHIVGYEPAQDLKKGAGFVCDGCWTMWVRVGFKIDGKVYTKLEHVTALGAPPAALIAFAARPGWDTVGDGPV